jgi:hypothetical protein
VLDGRQGYWQERKQAWHAAGIDSGDGRDGDLLAGFANAAVQKLAYEGKTVGELPSWATDTSLFDPVLAELLVSWYSNPGQRVLDLFAGGSVCGIVTTRLRRGYTGVDPRPEQVAANEAQAAVHPTLVTAQRPDYTPPQTPVEHTQVCS